jgi:hypothetical protein
VDGRRRRGRRRGRVRRGGRARRRRARAAKKRDGGQVVEDRPRRGRQGQTGRRAERREEARREGRRAEKGGVERAETATVLIKGLRQKQTNLNINKLMDVGTPITIVHRSWKNARIQSGAKLSSNPPTLVRSNPKS